MGPEGLIDIKSRSLTMVYQITFIYLFISNIFEMYLGNVTFMIMQYTIHLTTHIINNYRLNYVFSIYFEIYIQ